MTPSLLRLFLWSSLNAIYLQAAPLIDCRIPEYDFGGQVAIQEISHDFILWNRGDHPLIITEVKGCCGMQATVDSRTIPPGSNTTCTATFNTRNRYGKQTKTITVSSNAKNSPRLELNLEGNLLRPVDFSPRIVRFAPNQTVQLISVTNLLNSAVTLKSASTRIKGLTVSIQQSSERDWLLKLEKDPSQVAGKIRGNVELIFSFGSINIPVIESKKALFRVVPRPEIEFPATATNETERLITVISNDKKPFEVTAADLVQVQGRIEIRKHSDNRWEIRVSAIPPSIQPDSVLQILTTSKLQPFITVPIKFGSP